LLIVDLFYEFFLYFIAVNHKYQTLNSCIINPFIEMLAQKPSCFLSESEQEMFKNGQENLHYEIPF